MKRWKIPPADGSVPLSFARHVVSGIGGTELAKHFLEAIQGLLPATYCTVFALEADGRVSAVSTASAYGEMATMTAIEYMRLGFDRKDSNMVWLAGKKTPQQSQMWLSHQHEEEVADAEYRRVCYGDPGIRERTSVLLLLTDGRRIAISYYRSWTLAPFTVEEFDQIGQCAPLLMEAVKAHIRQLLRETPSIVLRERIRALLPHRERQVITHILAGRTTKESAAILELSSNTVLTYRYRAFTRLGIRTQRELLALLEHTPASIGRVREK